MLNDLQTIKANQSSILGDRGIGLIAAIALHLLFLFSGGLGLVQKPEFGMSGSDSGYEVDLVAALPGEMSHSAPRDESVKQIIPVTDQDLVAPDLKVKEIIANSGPVGDGSSPVPGQDATTRRAGGNGFIEARPGYFRNPPPAYPEEARKQGQQGIVLLRVMVADKGGPISIAVAESSGFSLLDEAAVAAVKKWKFKPARMNGIPVESEVEIPLQFKLDQY